jgi:hypothetical protein
VESIDWKNFYGPQPENISKHFGQRWGSYQRGGDVPRGCAEGLTFPLVGVALDLFEMEFYHIPDREGIQVVVSNSEIPYRR